MIAWAAAVWLAAAPADYFRIAVIDASTGRGVPLVELKTVNGVAFHTDSHGLIAFHEPGLMDRDVYFYVASHGYELPRDLLGNRGVRLTPRAGARAEIRLRRRNVAERLYRITGQGLYRDTVLLGEAAPLREGLLNAEVMGQDTVIAAPYRGKIYWFWGDTDRVSHALGHFGAAGATSELPSHGGLDPSIGVDLSYFVGADGFSKPTCAALGPGMKWIVGLFTLVDASGRERLLARVARMKGLDYAYDRQLALFDDETQAFAPLVRWDIHEAHISAHPFRARAGGADYFYVFPDERVKADLDSLRDRAAYESFTCLRPDGGVDRDANGRVRYRWRNDAPRLDDERKRALVASGALRADEDWRLFHDVETGAPIAPGWGSVAWNEYRRRWIAILGGPPGDVWLAEADTPTGPWVYARRVASHDRYNFYNPAHHPFFDQDGGRRIYFEGTYTASFSEAPAKTPRYDYNQVMYRLDLADPRLALPAPVYRVRSAEGKDRYAMREGVTVRGDWARVEEAAFFAVPPERSRAGLVAIVARETPSGMVLETGGARTAPPLFLALPAVETPHAGVVEGEWRARATGTDGGELTFDLALERSGEVVSGRLGDASTIDGSFRSGRLELRVSGGEATFTMEGGHAGARLEGTWRRADGAESGTWSAERVDPTPAEDRSPRVAPLYEYRGKDGVRLYSTAPDLATPGLTRAEWPLCRVWRNPASILALDAEAQPVLVAPLLKVDQKRPSSAVGP